VLLDLAGMVGIENVLHDQKIDPEMRTNRLHGIRKTQPLEDGVVAVRMVVVPVIGHRSDESELLPFTIENDIGFQLRIHSITAQMQMSPCFRIPVVGELVAEQVIFHGCTIKIRP
jgi:hypothetical protein